MTHDFSTRFRCFIRLLVGATLVLLVAGGLVTSTDSGLAVPDWPLSFGTLFPPMVGGVIFEHSHRMIAGFVAILTLVLAIWAQQRARRLVRRLAWLAVGLVIVQALLGGLTVLLKLPALISASHACLGQLFFCVLCIIAMLTSKGWRNRQALVLPHVGWMLSLYLLLPVTLFGQIFMGAWVRHTGSGVVLHIVGGLAVLALTILVLSITAMQPKQLYKLTKYNLAFVGLIMLQLCLGLATLIFTHMESEQASSLNEVLFATGHQTLGAVILAVSVLMCVYLIGAVKK